MLEPALIIRIIQGTHRFAVRKAVCLFLAPAVDSLILFFIFLLPPASTYEICFGLQKMTPNRVSITGTPVAGAVCLILTTY